MQPPVALERATGIVELRLVARELALGLLQLHLERTRVDLGEQVPLLHQLPLAEGDVDELTVDAALHGDGVEGGHRAEPGQVNG